MDIIVLIFFALLREKYTILETLDEKRNVLWVITDFARVLCETVNGSEFEQFQMHSHFNKLTKVPRRSEGKRRQTQR